MEIQCSENNSKTNEDSMDLFLLRVVIWFLVCPLAFQSTGICNYMYNLHHVLWIYNSETSYLAKREIMVRDEVSITAIHKNLNSFSGTLSSTWSKNFKNTSFFIIYLNSFTLDLMVLNSICDPTLTHFTESRVETRGLRSRQWKRGFRRSAV